MQPVLGLLGAQLAEREDALGHGASPGLLRLQAQDQSTAAERLQTHGEHKGLHEDWLLGGRKGEGGGGIDVEDDVWDLMSELLFT